MHEELLDLRSGMNGEKSKGERRGSRSELEFFSTFAPCPTGLMQRVNAPVALHHQLDQNLDMFWKGTSAGIITVYM
jgi:hypothetical protein